MSSLGSAGNRIPNSPVSWSLALPREQLRRAAGGRGSLRLPKDTHPLDVNKRKNFLRSCSQCLICVQSIADSSPCVLWSEATRRASSHLCCLLFLPWAYFQSPLLLDGSTLSRKLPVSCLFHCSHSSAWKSPSIRWPIWRNAPGLTCGGRMVAGFV